ncbi:ATP-binding protein [Rhodovulum sulfidophilum]|uniref:ATP-binding protein n=1 Tax=Rhodovulum sulfidophilum TaxID=35806 RepID=UPI001911FA38|nr:ATP-binding protein [Rhodovulum sulfidophilum]
MIEIRRSDSHAWIGQNLIPWLSECSGVQVKPLAELRTCVSELFNNIADHTGLDVGSIFAQWYPNERRIEICIADFGPGIPHTVARVKPGLTDAEAISKALEDGFTSKSLPTNQGVGLHYLQQNVVENLDGELSIQSCGGGLNVKKIGNIVRKVPYSTGGFCPGTMIEMRFSTDRIDQTDEDGEFAW